MNKRPLMIVLALLVLTSAGGCTPFRNFFFGRGAQCGGVCGKPLLPLRRNVPLTVAPAPTCNTAPTYQTPAYNPQPAYGTPYVAAPSNACGTCAPADPCAPAYAYSPYDGGVVGNGVNSGYYNNGQWYPREYQSNYGYYGPGYRVDKDGNRIVFEEPLPPGVISAE
ncbi:hypothetical protein [Roseiconus lacunae]|uniref:Lipoprotein n=1 Tax=Roseiconus lacunae TaxID=2605694 RepID=A0ABT7PQJ9_9BACT|nr:hypothetical protein [Roseiconus lacunae]MCD0462514.1 hypothetical protein [Roseiconus lacunae]MDM4018406.1 hypothetical protein [Roseiconus lacunae]WRQ49274.1 hypothetical protein U8335_20225 [Stieleria sp. HD01]